MIVEQRLRDEPDFAGSRACSCYDTQQTARRAVHAMQVQSHSRNFSSWPAHRYRCCLCSAHGGAGGSLSFTGSSVCCITDLASTVLLCMALGKVPILVQPFGLQEGLGCGLSSTDLQIKSVESLVFHCALPDEMTAVGLAFCTCKENHS